MNERIRPAGGDESDVSGGEEEEESENNDGSQSEDSEEEEEEESDEEEKVLGQAVLWIQIHWIWIRIQDFGPIWIRIQVRIRIQGNIINFERKNFKIILEKNNFL